MPAKTDFLELTLPALNEFLNKWHTPTNQNFEIIDDWVQDLHAALVGEHSSSEWAALVGSLDNLVDRLAVSINPDGTINVDGSPGIVALATSSTRGEYDSPTERMDAGDFEVFNAGQPVVGSRFVPIPFAGPTAGYPPESLEAGMAMIGGDYSGPMAQAVAAPHVPWSPGLMAGGANPLITGLAVGQIRITADVTPAVFNIDGYIFRIREILDLDWNLIDGGGAPANNEYVWLYVSRVDADYNNANYRYKGPGGAIAVKDLRKLQQGTANGVTSGSVFTCAAALFNTAFLGKVKSGDVLVIEGGAGAGEYVIDELDGATPDTKLTIRGEFAGASSGISWHVRDRWHPNVGAVVTDTDPTTMPAQVAGRVYFARARHNTGGAPASIVTFTAGGVYDSGWSAVDAGADFPKTFIHNLGAYPTDVQVWFRESATANRQYQGLVRRTVVTAVDEVNTTLDPGDTTTADLLFPSVHVHTSEINVTLELLNATTDPAAPEALFTDSGGTDVTVGEVRVIARK
jgi:hypothetical protein